MRKRTADSRMAVVESSQATDDARRAKRTQTRLAAPPSAKPISLDFDLPWRSDPLEVEFVSDVDASGVEDEVPASQVHEHNLSTANAGKTFATLVSVSPFAHRSMLTIVLDARSGPLGLVPRT